MLCPFTTLIIELYLPAWIIPSWMLLTGVTQSAREIRARVGRGELGGGILFPKPNFIFQKQLNSQFSLEFPKVNADLYSPVSGLGEENDECSVLPERWI